MSISNSTQTFGPRNYVGLKYSFPISKIKDQSELYDTAYNKLFDFMSQNNIEAVGPSAFIYTKWDSENDITEVVISYPFSSDDVSEQDLTEFEVVTVPESNALIAHVEGSYDQLEQAHGGLMDYAKTLNIDPSFAFFIEEYEVMDTEDEKNNITNVIYTY